MAEETAGKKRLKRPVEELRAELLKDPDTARIAKAVQMDLKDYVEKVLDYAQNPDKKPVFTLGDEADMRAAGYNPPGEKEIYDLVAAAVRGDLDPGAEFRKSEFSAEPGRKPAVAGLNDSGTPVAGTQDEARHRELMEQVKKGGGGGRA